jgi:hypothetical protein
MTRLLCWITGHIADTESILALKGDETVRYPAHLVVLQALTGKVRCRTCGRALWPRWDT